MTAADTWGKLRSLVLDRNERRARVSAELGMSFVRVKALRIVAAGPGCGRSRTPTWPSWTGSSPLCWSDPRGRAANRRRPYSRIRHAC